MEKKTKKHQSSPWDRPVIRTFMCFRLVQYWLDRLFEWCNPCLPDPNPTTKKSKQRCVVIFLLVAPASSWKELTLEREHYVGHIVHRLQRILFREKQLHSINMLLARFAPTGRGSCYSTSSCTTSKGPVPVVPLSTNTVAVGGGDFGFSVRKNWHTSQSFPSFSFGSTEISKPP